MSTRSEADLRADVSWQNIQLQQREQERAAIIEQIERLREADRQMANEKRFIREIRQEVRNKEGQNYPWRGKTESDHDDYVSQCFRSRYNTYFDEADDLHDAIIRRIVQLENESREIGGIIGGLINSINTLWGEIRTLIN